MSEKLQRLFTAKEIAVSAAAICAVVGGALSWAYVSARDAEISIGHANEVPAIKEKLANVEQGVETINAWRVKKDASDKVQAEQIQLIREEQIRENTKREVENTEIMRRLKSISEHLRIVE